MARPSKFKAEFTEQAAFLSSFGATDAEMATFFKVSEQTFNAWKEAYPKFLESLKKSKEHADLKVERSLYERAKGYSHPDVDIRTVAIGGGISEIVQTPITKHYPPDPTSIIFWLKNRQKEKWRERHEMVVQNPEGTHLMQQVATELARIDRRSA